MTSRRGPAPATGTGPHENAAARKHLGSQSTAGLRRRRDAARRLPPLEDGQQDPLFPTRTPRDRWTDTCYAEHVERRFVTVEAVDR